MDLKEFVSSYVRTALWSSSDGDVEFLDSQYSAEDISQESMAKMEEDCKAFIEKAKDLLTEENFVRAGADFWLNRNGHGTGFWDREEIYGEAQAKALSDLSEQAGSCDIYVGDDGLLYI